MEILDLYNGNLSWSDYFQQQPIIEGLEDFFSASPVSPESMASKTGPSLITLELSPGDYETVLESGLGAMGAAISKTRFQARVAATALALQRLVSADEAGTIQDERQFQAPDKPSIRTLELGMDILAGGIDRLNADFN